MGFGKMKGQSLTSGDVHGLPEVGLNLSTVVVLKQL